MTTTTDEPTASTAPDPLRLTLADLRELNVCGDYLRAFGRLFPPSEYPDGAPLDEATCRAYAADFDWSWATEYLLTWQGRDELDALVRSRDDAWRRLGDRTGVRRAAALGYLLHHHPAYRSSKLLDVTVNRQRRADDRVLRDLDRARRDVTEAEDRAAEWARLRDERRALLPPLEEAAAAALRRRVERTAAERAENVRLAEEALATARARAEEADAALAALPVPAAADATAPTAPTEATS